MAFCIAILATYLYVISLINYDRTFYYELIKLCKCQGCELIHLQLSFLQCLIILGTIVESDNLVPGVQCLHLPLQLQVRGVFTLVQISPHKHIVN